MQITQRFFHKQTNYAWISDPPADLTACPCSPTLPVFPPSPTRLIMIGKFYSALYLAFFLLFPTHFALSAEITPEQQYNTFNGSVVITKQSFHWDNWDSANRTAVEATTPRVILPVETLSTLTWDPVQPSLYQQKTIGNTTYDCTLVATYTKSYGSWDQPSGTPYQLSYTSGNTTHYTFPWVTSGNSIQSYLRTNYFSSSSASPTSGDVALRITQSLGVKPVDMDQKGLAFFWVPLDNLARPAYSAGISSQLSFGSDGNGTHTYADGSYIATNSGTPASFKYVDYLDNTILYSGANATSTFVENTQAQTQYPWTAMGYTYNWNFLQDGTNPAYGLDTGRVTSFVGLSEFVVSSNTTVILESWVSYDQLAAWAVPEPGSLILLALGTFFLLVFHRRCGNAQVAQKRTLGGKELPPPLLQSRTATWRAEPISPVDTCRPPHSKLMSR